MSKKDPTTTPNTQEVKTQQQTSDPGLFRFIAFGGGLADMGTYLDESLLSGKYGLIYAEDAKQLPKEALPKEVYQGLCLKKTPQQTQTPKKSKPNSKPATRVYFGLSPLAGLGRYGDLFG